MDTTDVAIACWATGPTADSADHDGYRSHPAIASLLDRLAETSGEPPTRTVLILVDDRARPDRPTLNPDGPPARAATLPSALRWAAESLVATDIDLALVLTTLDETPDTTLAVALRRTPEAICHGEDVRARVACAGLSDRSGRAVRSAGELLQLLKRAPDGRWLDLGPADASAERDGTDHVVLLPAPDLDVIRQAGDPIPLVWSAPDEDREVRRRQALARLVTVGGADELEKVARVAASNAGNGPVRGVAVVTTPAEAGERLSQPVDAPQPRQRPVALLFPGQGAQYPRMAAGLYEHEPVFTAAMDAVFAMLGEPGRRLRAEWLSPEPGELFDDGTCAQPLLFAVGYALGRMIHGWGIRPAALLGHSVGEVVAATLAGVFTLPDAVRLMRGRVAAVVESPPGGMLAVAAGADELRPYLSADSSGQVSIAAVNAPRQTLVAGPEEALTIVEEKLRAEGYTCRRAKSRQAFHSPAILPAALSTRDSVAAARPHAPTGTVYSAYTGGLMTPETAADVMFWARQAADPVLFWPALEALLDSGDFFLVEAGVGQGLTNVARQHPAVRRRASDVVPLLPARPGEPAADRRTVLSAATRLWQEGHDLRWDALTGPVPARLP